MDVDDDGILATRQPNLAGAVLVGQIGEFDGVLGGDTPDGDVQSDVFEPVLFLIVDATWSCLPASVGFPAL